MFFGRDSNMVFREVKKLRKFSYNNINNNNNNNNNNNSNNIMIIKNCHSSTRVTAANFVCNDTDIFNKLPRTLEQILN